MNEQNEWIPSELYAEIMKHVPIVCVDVTLVNPQKTKALLCKRENEPVKGWYFSPGGRLFKNEELVDGAVRQAKRELGIDISAEQAVLGGFIAEIYPNSVFGENIGYHAITAYFGVIAPEDIAITLDNQHNDYKWFDIHDRSIHPCVQERINNILKKI